MAGQEWGQFTEPVPPSAFVCRFTHKGHQMLAQGCPVIFMSNLTGLHSQKKPRMLKSAVLLLLVS